MTKEGFYEWVHRPENDNKWFELVRGEVIEWPAPGKVHGDDLETFVDLPPRYGEYLLWRWAHIATRKCVWQCGKDDNEEEFNRQDAKNAKRKKDKQKR